MKKDILFYIKDNKDESVYAIIQIDTSDDNRLGWLRGRCRYPGHDYNNYAGADIGVDAETVFTTDRYDVSKDINNLMP